MHPVRVLVLIVAIVCWARIVTAEEQRPPDMVFPDPESSALRPPVQQTGPPSEALANALRLYQQEAYREASVQFERVVSGHTQDAANNHQRAQFFLGKSLFHLGFHQSALAVFEEIVHAGPSHAYFEATLPWLGHLSRELPEPAGIIGLLGQYGDSLEVLRQFDTNETRDLYDDLLYMMGRHWYRQGEPAAARRFFVQVGRGSRHYYPARFFAGVTHVRERRATPAVQAFRGIAEELDQRFFLNRRERRYRDLAWLSMARVYYSTRHWDSAVEAWNHVSPASEYWLDAMFEQSWARFQIDEFDRALGNIHTLTSPFFDEGAYPEVLVLQAVMYFHTCNYERANQSIARFQQFYEPLRVELESVVTADNDGAEREAFFRLAQRIQSGRESDISPAATRLLRSALGDRMLLRHLQYVELLDAEEERLSQLPPAFRNSGVGARILQDVAAARAVAVDTAGNVARARHQRFLQELQQLENQGTAVQIEILRAVRQNIVEDPESTPNLPPSEVTGDAEHVIWPFEGEYWRDELGAYREVIASNCGR